MGCRLSAESRLAAAGLGTDFSFSGLAVRAKVVEVYDGDTIRVRFFHRGQLVQHRVRMLGYDSPEVRPPLGTPGREKVLAAAFAARDALRGLVHGRVVDLRCGPFDKYGRVLGQVSSAGVDVSRWMLDRGFGVPYAGGARGAPAPPG